MYPWWLSIQAYVPRMAEVIFWLQLAPVIYVLARAFVCWRRGEKVELP